MSSPRKPNPLVRFAIERRVTMSMIILGVLVLGALSLGRLPLEFLPAFSSNSISVSVPYPSSSPEETERRIVRPLEDSLSTINGIETISANANAGQGSVRISFLEGTDMELAAVDVRDRVDRVRHLLPDDIDRVRIRRFQSTDIPVLTFDLSAAWPRAKLFDFAENTLQRRLERLDGVAQVDVRGLRTPEVQINLDPNRLRAHGVDLRQLNSALRENNVNLSVGDVIEGSRKLLIRAVGEFTSPEQIRSLPIGQDGLRMRDVAEVVYDFPRQESFNFLNGVESLTIAINKDSTSNLLSVVEGVKNELAKIEALPEAEGLSFRTFQDASTDVRKGLGQLRDAGLIGGLLSILAVFFFLRRFRTTLLVALAIPVSVVATFVLLYFMRTAGLSEITLNVVSLAGLMLALGMLVDNSIVVIESIFRHRNELHEDAKTAALMGTSEVALPIIASTATTMCVFLPLIFLSGGGRFKLYLENIAITICIVIVASLVVALTVVPMAAALILRGQQARPAKILDSLARGYARTLNVTLKHRLVFVALSAALLGGSIYLLNSIERAFSSRAPEREVIVKVDTPKQYSPEQIETLYKETYALIDSQRGALDIADIAYAYDRGTGRSGANWRRSRQFSVYLKDEDESKVTTAAAQAVLRDLFPVKAGVEFRIASGYGRYGSTGIEIELSGEDASVLELIANRIAAQLATLPMVRDVDTSLESGDQEIRVTVQRERTLAAGLSSQTVAQTVNNALSSRAMSRFKTDDREIDLIMQYREEDRETLDQLKNVSVFGTETPLPLGALAEFDFVEGPRSIERENHEMKVSVTANAIDSSASYGVMGAVQGIMAKMPMPPGYSWSFGRWNRYMQRDQDSGLYAILFALPLVYMLLAALFESFTQPLTIMFSVPFALIGVAGVMYLSGQPWDTMTIIGLIVLLGIVVNNAIVLITHINDLRAEGHPRDEAIRLGGKHRLRPILITAITTVLGMIPMVAPFLFPQWFGPVEGRAATWAPIGLVIIGGLTTSTFLTLLIIPTIYSLIDDASNFARRVVRNA
jgi:HAE1 family hydrophobic/amphiphilic exporter-1